MSDGNLIHYGRPDPKPSFKKKEKTKVSKETKVNVYTRDRGRCVVCGAEVVESRIPHHIEYKSEGGSHDTENQVLLGEHPLDFCNCHFQTHHGSLQVVIDRFIAFHGLKKTVQCLLKGVIR
jgi:hypothetical protein